MSASPSPRSAILLRALGPHLALQRAVGEQHLVALRVGFVALALGVGERDLGVLAGALRIVVAELHPSARADRGLARFDGLRELLEHAVAVALGAALALGRELLGVVEAAAQVVALARDRVELRVRSRRDSEGGFGSASAAACRRAGRSRSTRPRALRPPASTSSPSQGNAAIQGASSAGIQGLCSSVARIRRSSSSSVGRTKRSPRTPDQNPLTTSVSSLQLEPLQLERHPRMHRHATRPTRRGRE